ncbi:hypothetical protein HSX11_23655 [Oxalobacteraceae bacterium]|nr:hypothetical protein [Oxalobacteraceae bacterium]
MRQLTLELDDQDMARLEAEARVRRIDPILLAKAELLKMLETFNAVDAIHAAVTEAIGVVRDDSPEAKEDRRRARLAALMPSNGIWAGEPNKPKDGVVYQEEMRAEWP